MSASVRIAAAQYPVSEPAHWQAVETQLESWAAEAARAGAQLLVFPEYAAMSLAALFPPAVRGDLQAQLRALQELHADYRSLHRRLAQQYHLYILAGSFPLRVGEVYRNRAELFAPSGTSGWQDKWTMTRFETEQWGISAGRQLKVFDTALGRIGINICYDVEFPLLARAQVEAGAELILAPSCTDTTAGYWRVRLGAQARALENQCVVVQAPLVGDAPWSPAIDINVGAAGIYAPPDRGLPDDGLIACGEWNRPQWLHAEIDPQRLLAVRENGQVFNHRDWSLQPGLTTMPVVEVEPLR